MENPQTSTLAMHAVSRSRGKQPGESVYTTRLRERRKAKGQAKSSDESESDDEIEPGAVVLHKMFNRQVILHPDNTVVKSGKRIPIGEAEALRVAAQAGIPAPCVRDVHTSSDGQGHIRIDYIQGQSLDKLWPDMSVEQKKNIARQLREIVEKLRSVAPPPISSALAMVLRSGTRGSTSRIIPLRVAMNKPSTSFYYQPSISIYPSSYGRRFLDD